MQSTYIYTLKSLFQNFNGHGINWTLLLNLMRSKPNGSNENSSLEPTMRPMWSFSKSHQKEFATLQSVKKTIGLRSNKAPPFVTIQGLCTWMTAFDYPRDIESDKACATILSHMTHDKETKVSHAYYDFSKVTLPVKCHGLWCWLPGLVLSPLQLLPTLLNARNKS